jgi:hypothetical protein
MNPDKITCCRHPERSEGSKPGTIRTLSAWILRCAQNDGSGHGFFSAVISV